jgi:hypothetical protein
MSTREYAEIADPQSLFLAARQTSRLFAFGHLLMGRERLMSGKNG